MAQICVVAKILQIQKKDMAGERRRQETDSETWCCSMSLVSRMSHPLVAQTLGRVDAPSEL